MRIMGNWQKNHSDNQEIIKNKKNSANVRWPCCSPWKPSTGVPDCCRASSWVPKFWTLGIWSPPPLVGQSHVRLYLASSVETHALEQSLEFIKSVRLGCVDGESDEGTLSSKKEPQQLRRQKISAVIGAASSQVDTDQWSDQWSVIGTKLRCQWWWHRCCNCSRHKKHSLLYQVDHFPPPPDPNAQLFVDGCRT